MSLPTGIVNLRELRLWHWKKFVKARAETVVAEFGQQAYSRQGKFALSRKFARRALKKHAVANFHVKCVQALNDVVEGFVENDATGWPQ